MVVHVCSFAHRNRVNCGNGIIMEGMGGSISVNILEKIDLLLLTKAINWALR